MTQEKTCKKCKKSKPVKEFQKRNRNLDGYSSRCRECEHLSWEKYRNIVEKVCPACKNTLPVEEFSRCSISRDGCDTYCKKCSYQKQIAMKEKDRDRWNERARIATKRHIEGMGREKYLEYRRQWRSKNADRLREEEREERIAHPEKFIARRERYIERDPERYLRIARNITRRRRARKKMVGGTFSDVQFTEMCDKYGNKCLCCGRKDVNLVPDHVNPISLGGSNDISNIQPLCNTCNCSKNAKYIDYRTNYETAS